MIPFIGNISSIAVKARYYGNKTAGGKDARGYQVRVGCKYERVYAVRKLFRSS